MLRRFLAILLFSAIACWAQSGSASQEKRPGKRSAITTLTGCVDQKPGDQYILVKGPEMEKVADLKAVGFENDGFAKFVGDTVEVRGQLSQGVMAVRQIRRLAEGCVQK